MTYRNNTIVHNNEFMPRVASMRMTVLDRRLTMSSPAGMSHTGHCQTLDLAIKVGIQNVFPQRSDFANLFKDQRFGFRGLSINS